MTDLQDYMAPGFMRAQAHAAGSGCATGNCPIPEPYARKGPSGTVWVTLPGDNKSHALVPGEARRLMRELEEIV